MFIKSRPKHLICDKCLIKLFIYSSKQGLN